MLITPQKRKKNEIFFNFAILPPTMIPLMCSYVKYIDWPKLNEKILWFCNVSFILLPPRTIFITLSEQTREFDCALTFIS